MVDELMVWDTYYWKKMMRRGLYLKWLIRAVKFWKILKAQKYDLVISMQPEDWPTLMIGINPPRSIGIFDTFREYHRKTQTSPRQRYYTDVYSYSDLPDHRVDQYLLPLKALQLPGPPTKQMSCGYTADDEAFVERYLIEEDCKRFMLIAPATGWPSRQWSTGRFAEIGTILSRRYDCDVILISMAQEKEILDEVASKISGRVHIAAGHFSFRQIAALIKKAELVVSGDTGPMHMAAAMNTPSVSIFGPSPTERFAPQSPTSVTVSAHLECPPCHQYRCLKEGDDFMRCMNSISVDQVVLAAERLMREQSASPGYQSLNVLR